MMRYLPYDEEEEEDYEISTMDAHQIPDAPIYKCQNCSFKNPGYEEKQSSLLTLIVALIFLLVFQFYSILILPLLIEATKTITKKCLKCDHILDKQELLSTPSLTDKILNFKCGNCAIVISRKYALVIIVLLSLIWFLIPSQKPSINPGGTFLSAVTWGDFVEDCGKKVVLNNQVRAQRNFDQKYARNIIEWEGIVQDVMSRERIRDSMITFIVHIKMNPTEAQEEFPDVQLTFTNSVEKKYSDALKILTPGDIVHYKAVMIAMADEMHHHNFEALSISVTGEKMDLKMIPAINYAGVVNNMRGKGQQTSEPGYDADIKDSGTVDSKGIEDKVNQDDKKSINDDGDVGGGPKDGQSAVGDTEKDVEPEKAN